MRGHGINMRGPCPVGQQWSCKILHHQQLPLGNTCLGGRSANLDMSSPLGNHGVGVGLGDGAEPALGALLCGSAAYISMRGSSRGAASSHGLASLALPRWSLCKASASRAAQGAFGRQRRSDERWRLQGVQNAEVDLEAEEKEVQAQHTKEAIYEKQQTIAEKQDPATNVARTPLCLSALEDFAVGEGTTLVDIGANLGKCTPQDLAAQLVRAASAGVSCIIVTGCSVKGSDAARRLCERWAPPAGLERVREYIGAAALDELDQRGGSIPALVFTAGVHPHDAKSCDAGSMDTLRRLADNAQCVAIGECGLDYDRMFSPRDKQLEWCQKQVELAVHLDMPLFLHERDRDASKGPPLGSAQDLIDILTACNVEPSRACVHCFTGSETTLRAYIDQGFFIGLTGFAGMQKRGGHVRDLLARKVLPFGRLMIETDSPFMLPDKVYLPGTIGMQDRKNEPCTMPAVCRAVAECLGVTPAEVARVTTENASRFFSLQ